MKEAFEKINSYTLQVMVEVNHNEETSYYSSFKKEKGLRLTRIFNFESRQVTTLAESTISTFPQNRESGAAPATSLQMHVQDFAEVPNPDEIIRLHAKLTEMGGTPPTVEHLRTKLDKTRHGLSAPQ